MEGISSIDLIVLISSDQLLLILKTSVLFHTSYLKEEVNGTEPSPSVSSLLQLVKQP
jgi:hypothetical protein